MSDPNKQTDIIKERIKIEPEVAEATTAGICKGQPNNASGDKQTIAEQDAPKVPSKGYRIVEKQ
jgi:hypothetical protein